MVTELGDAEHRKLTIGRIFDTCRKKNYTFGFCVVLPSRLVI